MALPDRIKVSMEFMQPNGLKQWLTSEHPIVPEEDVVEEFKSSKALLVAAFKSMNPGLDISIDYSAGHPMNVTQVEKTNVDGSLVDHIRDAPDVETLETFRLLIKGNPGLQDIYDKKLKELQ